MMVPERWMVAAIVALSLAPAGAGQASAPTLHHAKKAGSASQPAGSGAPEQAIAPDPATPLEQTPNYDPPPPPPRPPDPAPPPAVKPAEPPAQAAAPSAAGAASGEAAAARAPAPPPLRPMTPQEQQLEKDSERLLTLVQELKEDVAKAGVNTLSLTALRRAEEIQRLSRDLKERLKSEAANGSRPAAVTQ